MSIRHKLALAAGIIPVIALSAQMSVEAQAVDFGALVRLNDEYGAYKEECMQEGCSGEEVEEMYWGRGGGYDEECIGEGCSGEEKAEYGADQDEHYSDDEDQEEGWEGFKDHVRAYGWKI